VRELTLMMHFANATGPLGATGRCRSRSSSRSFEGITAEWPEPRSLANSAALFLRPEVGGDSVRPESRCTAAPPTNIIGSFARTAGRHGR